MYREKEVADQLFALGAVLGRASSKDGRLVMLGEEPDGQGFRLKLHEQHPDFPLSPFYFNLRTADNPKPGPLNEQILGLVAELFVEAAERNNFRHDAVVGVPNAGNPFSEAMVKKERLFGKEVVRAQLSKVENAGKRRVVLPPRFLPQPHFSRVLLVDDLVSTFDSKNEARAALQQGGFRVEGMIVLIDRRSRGTVAPTDLHWQSIFTARDLFSYYAAEGVVSLADAEAVRAFLELPLPTE